MVLEKTTIPFYPHHINMQIHLYDLPKSEGRLCKTPKGWRVKATSTDKNGFNFIKNSKGSDVFGQITEEQGKALGIEPATIKLSEGKENMYGLRHIEARHGNEIKQAGYKDVVSFCEDIIENFDQIRKGEIKQRKEGPVQTYFLFKSTNNGVVGIELEKHINDDFYTVNNGGIFKKKNWQEKKDILWPLAHDGGTLPRSQGSVYKDELDKALEASYRAHRFSDIPIDIFAHDEEKVKSIFDLYDLPKSEGRLGEFYLSVICHFMLLDIVYNVLLYFKRG